MTWINEFIEWCRIQREISVEQAERYESGQQRLFNNNVDVSEGAGRLHRNKIAEMDAMIARAERDRDA